MNIYLSKRYGRMFQFKYPQITEIFSKKVEREPRISRLGMIISKSDGGNVIEEVGALPRRAISRSANGYLYSFLLDVSGHELRCMEISKEFVISSLAASPSEKRPTMSDSLQLARLKLSSLVPPDRIEPLSYIVAHDTVGYGPISMILEDKQNIEEIEINSPLCPIIIYSTKYGRCITNLRFSSEFAFRSAINRLITETEKEISESTPIIDAQVSDLRVHAQMRPYAVSGATASIRVGGRKEIDLGYLLSKQTATPDILAYLWLAAESKYNMIVSGAPASGKTTLLSALNAFVPTNEKVVTIEEDVNEMNGTGVGNVIALYGSRYNSITPKEQVINALRMRPGRIIIGEMRGEEARDLFMGANIGISFATTMHSNEGGMQILKKLLVKPMCVDTRGIGALDIAVYMRQIDISRRMISGISEYRWLSRAEIEEGTRIGDEDMVQVNEIVKDCGMDKSALKESKLMGSYSRINGITVKEALKEFEKRAKLIEKSAGSAKPNSVEDAVRKYSGW
jgi:flagellar protein FlaI